MLAVLLMAVVLTGFSLVMWWLSRRFVPDENAHLVSQVVELLPKIQCAQCGYPGCEPYARAMIFENETTDKCVPGGMSVRQGLSTFFGGKVIASSFSDEVVYIVEEDCIGCMKCIRACPYDAIVGAAKLMHTVITDYCTGCMLCVDVCPTSCIKIKKI